MSSVQISRASRERVPWPEIGKRRPGPRHLKVVARGDGGVVLEFCEDPACAVGRDGIAGCGRLACPRCGSGGLALSAPQLADLLPGERVACACGHAWRPASAR